MDAFFLTVALLAGLCPSSGLYGADAYFNTNTLAQKNTQPVTPQLWNLHDADIQQVAIEVSRETHKNFLIDPRVNGHINIVSSTPLPPDEVYQMFLSMLQVLNYTIIPTNTPDLYKIIPLSGSLSQNIPVSTYNKSQKGGELVVRVIGLQHVSASKIIPILRPLIPDTGSISNYFPANALIITSSVSNIDHLMKVISALDQANTNQIEVIPLHQAMASDVITVLNTLDNDMADESHVIIVADPHTNSLLLKGDLQGRLKIRHLIARLDVSAPAGFEGNTQVVYLHYLKAAKIAPVLMKVAKADSSSGSSDSKSSGENVNIQAEPSTNSLILTAPPTVMHNLQSVVAQLDIRPAQVLVEAAIVEIDEGTLKQLGVQWGTINKENSTDSTLNADGSTSVTSGGDADSGSVAITRGALPVGYNQGVGVIKSGNFREIISLLQQSQSTDILSTPSLVVLDNQTAKIDVGKTLSIQTGSYASTDNTTSVDPFNTFDRQQIGLHLYVTPQINLGDAVQLKIDQGNETLENPLNPTTTPVTNNSGIKTTVLVNTGDILVLGGLISNNEQNGESKIPFLGDIPGVGKLFQYHTHTNVKKNLMVFLKPIILYNQQNSIAITNSKYDFIRNQEMRWKNNQPMQSTEHLPPLPTDIHLPTPFEHTPITSTP